MLKNKRRYRPYTYSKKFDKNSKFYCTKTLKDENGRIIFLQGKIYPQAAVSHRVNPILKYGKEPYGFSPASQVWKNFRVAKQQKAKFMTIGTKGMGKTLATNKEINKAIREKKTFTIIVPPTNTAGAPYMSEETRQALRYNTGKPQWSLVHFKSLEPMVRVLEYGANKYTVKEPGTNKILTQGRENWKKGMDKTKILECAIRHLASMIDGEEIDKESGQPHAGHVLCNMMFYQYNVDKENSNNK